MARIVSGGYKYSHNSSTFGFEIGDCTLANYSLRKILIRSIILFDSSGSSRPGDIQDEELPQYISIFLGC